MLEILSYRPHWPSLKLTALKLCKEKWEAVEMRDRRQRVSVTPFILSAPVWNFTAIQGPPELI